MYASLTMGCISLFFIEQKQYLLLKKRKKYVVFVWVFPQLQEV